MRELIRVEVTERVAVVTLDDPRRRNAMSVGLAESIRAAFDELEAREDVGAAVITGSPPAFCAGADLSELGTARREGLRAIYEGFLRIRRSPLPSVAAVNGPAVGAGLNLALTCDLRIAGSRARFDSRFLDLGLHPGGGHTWLLREVVGPEVTRAMVLAGEVLDGRAAVERGLAYAHVEEQDPQPLAVRLAGKMARVPVELLRDARETISAMGQILSHADAVERELDPQVRSLERPEFATRLAQLQKRIAGPRDEG